MENRHTYNAFVRNRLSSTVNLVGLNIERVDRNGSWWSAFFKEAFKGHESQLKSVLQDFENASKLLSEIPYVNQVHYKHKIWAKTSVKSYVAEFQHTVLDTLFEVDGFPKSARIIQHVTGINEGYRASVISGWATQLLGPGYPIDTFDSLIAIALKGGWTQREVFNITGKKVQPHLIESYRTIYKASPEFEKGFTS